MSGNGVAAGRRRIVPGRCHLAALAHAHDRAPRDCRRGDRGGRRSAGCLARASGVPGGRARSCCRRGRPARRTRRVRRACRHTSRAASSAHLDEAENTIEGWLEDLGVERNDTENTTQDADSSETQALARCSTVSGRASGAVFAALLSRHDALQPYPSPTAPDPGLGERHIGVPAPVAARSARGLSSPCGATSSASRWWRPSTRPWSGSGPAARRPTGGNDRGGRPARRLGPYVGAWTAGAFSVLVALGGAGTDAESA